MDVLVRWLAGLSADDLAALLRARPEVVGGALPATLTDFAHRLIDRDTMVIAVKRLDYFTIGLLQGIIAIGGDVDRSGIDSLVAGRAEPAEVDAVLDRLTVHALLLPDGERFVIAPGVDTLWSRPAGLGPSAVNLLSGLPLHELRHIGRNVGLGSAQSKVALVGELSRLLRDEDAVVRLTRDAPPEAAALLAEAAGGSGAVQTPVYETLTSQTTSPTLWLRQRGLLVGGPYGVAEIPREIVLMVRDGDILPDLTPRPPVIPVRPFDAGRAEAVAGQAAAGLLGMVDAVAAEMSVAPLAQLKSRGVGVGVREMRRLAAAAGIDQRTAGQIVELLHLAGLLAPVTSHVWMTDGYDTWAALDPSARWLALATVWTGRAVPLTDSDPTQPVLGSWVDVGDGEDDMLPDVLTSLEQHPGATAGELAAHMRWAWPVRYRSLSDFLETLIAARLEEAALVGVVADGVLVEAGKALRDGDHDRAAAAVRPHLTEPTSTATLIADLTAVAAGPPTLALASLLDVVAEREGRDAAQVWRFTPASVRRAFDQGYSEDGLLAALGEIATHGVPATLARLVADAARQHGRLRIGSAACWIRAVDAPLLAQVLHDRRLRPLELRQVTPDLAVSDKPLPDVLRAMRAAGYAPVAEGTDGAPVLTRAQPQRAKLSKRAQAERRHRAETLRALGRRPDLSALAPEIADELLAAWKNAPPPPRIPEQPSLNVAS